MLPFIDPTRLQGLAALRREVREFIAAEAPPLRPETWDHFDPDFSRRVAARGWIGMSWPREYGGQARSPLERYVVTEELLAAGAPVRAHWAADRQIGPLLLAAGSAEARRTILPRIAAGECYFCIGMSEPDSGSDLASIRTRAVRGEGGWRVSGTKVWSSYAHRAHYMNLYARTTPFDPAARHCGITQFVLDMQAPGVTVRPIRNLAAEHDFNEVILDDVHIPDEMLLGQEGQAWAQASTELAHERAGAERWLGTHGLLSTLIDAVETTAGDGDAEGIGRLVARLWTLHRMSLAITADTSGDANLPVLAAMVKDMGTELDQAVPETARQLVSRSRALALEDDGRFTAMLNRALLYAPAYSIRGGTREVLRGMIARGIGLR